MLVGWIALLLALLVGELLSSKLGLPLPGAVLGMALLALWLGVRRRPHPRVERAAEGLLEHLPLLFVPAGVGAMQLGPTLRSAWLPILVTLVVGTMLTLLATALTLRACLALQGRKSGAHD
jgi:holin-like protein